MAEAVFRHQVGAAGLDHRFEIDSAGTGGWHAGEPPHAGTRRVLARHGIDATGIRARQIDRDDLEVFDYILTMDDANLAHVRALGPARGTVAPLLDFAPSVGEREVPDPYYDGRFDAVFALVDVACADLLRSLRAEHAL